MWTMWPEPDCRATRRSQVSEAACGGEPVLRLHGSHVLHVRVLHVRVLHVGVLHVRVLQQDDDLKAEQLLHLGEILAAKSRNLISGS